ncbi:membrane protein [Gemmatimonadetes bacterium T265]|nr:membrane protein [Gemmatimonadetes bacterium T265]
MIGLGFVYALMGVLTAVVAVANARDASHPRRWRAAAFWGLWSLTFFAGPALGDVGAGLVVVALGALAGLGGGFARPAGAPATAGPAPGGPPPDGRSYGNRLFVPALLVPAVTVAGTWAYRRLRVGGAPLVDPAQPTLVALGTGALVGLAAAVALVRPAPAAPARETRRLMDAVGWAAVLPQALAALGAVFAAAGVGRIVADGLERVVPLGIPFAAVAAYTLGMALFTAVLGNAFAAFPVMTLALGLPVLVGRFGADPAAVAALGMLSGFCGTLCTPMAANFNVVPVALLDLPDEWAVIRVQAPTALALLAANTAILYAVVARP